MDMQDSYTAPMPDYRRTPSPERRYRSPPSKYYRDRSRSYSPNRDRRDDRDRDDRERRRSPDRRSRRYRSRSRDRYGGSSRYDSYRSRPSSSYGGGARDGSSQQERRVYVGNLAYHIKWTQLKDFMRQAGNVVFADVLTLSNGKSKGCGIVEYSTREEAQKAIDKLTNLDFDGREIFVREDRETDNSSRGRHPPPPSSSRDRPPPPSDGSQLFIANLPYSAGWQDLKDLFREAGDIVRADVYTNNTGRSKGVGTVLFSNPNDAEIAIEKFNGFEMDGRALEVRVDRLVRGGPAPDASRPAPEPNAFTDGARGNGPMSETIFVDNLPWATTDNDLVELFQTVGTVERAQIQLEPSGRSAGSGVVKFDTPASADIAIEKFHNYNYGNRPLKLSFVSYSDASAPPPPPPVTIAGIPEGIPTPGAIPFPVSAPNPPPF
ncbi:similar to Saccharomyces cerevisiae YNL004W HRB1 Poly(A+) RNA-binding protein [Geotrichum candidum]|uniref:Similar to Saccharomyces cerevisiae YNL004W HRB1 Poly(A+) RNA-binding protein n=1 Tax=Geotrichum candidum TaxID=1173061 RepID=A0A0J9XA61_GEOCN|nr:similar to Saccharomyces cerevisiae YNL004W HRB1 Poly(A+) RNA-binding protein [Geotrichum candidum]